MRIFVSVLAILFGGLHFIAGLTQFKAKEPAARGLATAMACGGIALICAAIVNLMGHLSGWQDVIALVTGCLLICAAAYENGRRSGNFHLSHHIVRGGIAVLLIIGFLVW